MKPPFQRNPVWITPQKSYLIDSILNGYPVPELYMQEFIDEQGNERHVVVDGQQRIRACLEFIEGRFSLNEEETPTWGNMKFEDLSPNDKKRIFGYTFIVRILPDIPDEEIRGIFQRINKNVVALNAQELRQATYWGPFLKTMQEVSNYSYWSTSGVFTPLNIRRMMDIEYVSELSIATLHGHQNKKETLDKYYLEYEEEFDSKDDLISIFQAVLFEIEQIYPDIKNTRWKKKTDFYSLFVFLASKSKYLPLNSQTRREIRDALDNFANNVTRFLSTDSEVDRAGFKQTVEEYARAIRASSDIGNRRRRHHALEQELDQFFGEEAKGSIEVPITPIQEGLFDTVSTDDDEST